MQKWIDCGADFTVADVVRWTERVYARPLTRRGRQRKTGKPVCIGEREVAAEVLTAPDARGFVTLLVRLCREVAAHGVQPVPMFTPEQIIRRKKTTLAKGKAVRLQWSDEGARRSVVETDEREH